MLKQPFERMVRQLCEDVLSEPTPKALPDEIIKHVQKSFPVEWSTLWLTEQERSGGKKRVRLAAAAGPAEKLKTAEKGDPAVYDFGEGLTGYIAEKQCTVNIRKYSDFKDYPAHARKYDDIMYGYDTAESKCRCVLGVPLLLKSAESAGPADPHPWRVIGVLKLENVRQADEHPEAYFNERDVQIVQGYAAVIAVALEKAQMRADSIRIGAGLLEVTGGLLARLGQPPDLKQIVQQTANVISAEACSLWLRSGLQLQLKAAHGYPGQVEQVPAYPLEPEAEVDGGARPPTADLSAGERTRYKRIGLTVYVARTGKSLNLRTADEVRTHFAWQGANDERMWNKPQGEACYSLVAIPLIDTDTQDLLGVFKIENKKPTLFQLQSYFTKEDEQLLTTLGNSISFSLIISHRVERLSRLEKLVGDVRVFNGLDEALFFILTGLTHRDGLRYNRAMAFLVDESDKLKPKLVCRSVIGQIAPRDWQAEMDRTKAEEPLNLDELFRQFRENKEKFLDNPMMRWWKDCEISLADGASDVMARDASVPKPTTRKHLSGDLLAADTLSGFARGDFVLIPITFEKKLTGIIYADNAFTGNRVNRFETDMLDLFAGMAGAIIEAASVPEKLQRERDEAWRSFSRPAAHRVGTEASIIDSEACLRIKRELDLATPDLSGRLAVRGENIRNSLQVIQQAVDRLRLAVRDYQRLSTEAEDPETFDLCELIDQTIKNTISNFKNIQVALDYGERPIWVHAAPRVVAYVLEELLINAWKQAGGDDSGTARGDMVKMKVAVRVWREQENVVCMVCDNGRGIPTALIPTLFHKPGRGRKGGTGLGLYISHQILRQNGGNIELLDRGMPPDYGGACFRIALPGDDLNHSARISSGIKAEPHVLVVEDDETLKGYLFSTLEEAGFSCDWARNENEALQRLTSDSRAVVADIDLSEGGGDARGGIVLAKRLAMLNQKIPIVLISQTPSVYSSELREMQENRCLHSVIDRNTSSFYDKLVEELRKALNKE